jgi:hypothetical protein
MQHLYLTLRLTVIANELLEVRHVKCCLEKDVNITKKKICGTFFVF